MTSKKFALLLVIALVIACVPAFAGAKIVQVPSYNQVKAGDTKITGTSLDALTLKFTFPNKVTISKAIKGGVAVWSVPVSGTLKVDDRIRVDYTDGTTEGSGWFFIFVSPAGRSLDGSTNGGSGNTNSGNTSTATDTGTGTGTTTTVATTGNGAADSTTATDSAIPRTGDVRPMLTFASALFIIGLALALLIRALWLRRRQA